MTPLFCSLKTPTCLSSEFEDAAFLFAAGYDTKRNLLGYTGWLNNLHLALTMDDEMIYLNPAYSQENL